MVNQEDRCQLVFCAPSEDQPFSQECLEKILRITAEHGLMLWTGKSCWPTEADATSQALRDTVLKETRIRAIVDLRNFHSSCIDLLVPLRSSKSALARTCDSHRPAVFRVRGITQKSSELELLWNFLSSLIGIESAPGEVRNLSVAGTPFRVEAMAAAATQSQLRGSPWTTLAEPEFFRAVGALRS